MGPFNGTLKVYRSIHLTAPPAAACESPHSDWRRSAILPKVLAMRIVAFLVGGVLIAFGLTVPLDFEVLEELRVATGWRIVFLVLGVMLVVATLVPRFWPMAGQG